MADLKDKLKGLIKSYKKTAPVDDAAIERMKKVAEAAKKARKEAESSKA